MKPAAHGWWLSPRGILRLRKRAGVFFVIERNRAGVAVVRLWSEWK